MTTQQLQPVGLQINNQPAGAPLNMPRPALQVEPTTLLAKVRALPPITTVDQEKAFAGLLAFAVKMQQEVHAHYDPVVEATHAAHKAAIALRAEYTDCLDDVERRLRKALAEWLDTPAAQEAHADESAAGGAVKLRRNVDVIIEDVNAIPREYLLPDTKKIAKVLKAGVAIPGCRLEKRATVALKKGGA